VAREVEVRKVDGRIGEHVFTGRYMYKVVNKRGGMDGDGEGWRYDRGVSLP